MGDPPSTPPSDTVPMAKQLSDRRVEGLLQLTNRRSDSSTTFADSPYTLDLVNSLDEDTQLADECHEIIRLGTLLVPLMPLSDEMDCVSFCIDQSKRETRRVAPASSTASLLGQRELG